ncbi:MAG: hypothetical protein GY835_13205 [bacterium]|nr:hypothetical protein [bacterium]
MKDDESRSAANGAEFTPPENCPNSDPLANPAPRGRFRMDHRLFIGIFLLLIAVVYGALPDEVWVIAEVDGSTGERSELAPGFSISSGEIEVIAGSEVELQLGRRLRLRIIGPARVYLPAGPGRWFSKGRTLIVEQGRVLGTSGGSPLGYAMVLETGRERATLVGGSFIVEHNDDFSGFALREGDMALETGSVHNSEKLRGNYLTISGETAIRYETRSLTLVEQEELARLMAKGLPALAATGD